MLGLGHSPAAAPLGRQGQPAQQPLPANRFNDKSDSSTCYCNCNV